MEIFSVDSDFLDLLEEGALDLCQRGSCLKAMKTMKSLQIMKAGGIGEQKVSLERVTSEAIVDLNDQSRILWSAIKNNCDSALHYLYIGQNLKQLADNKLALMQIECGLHRYPHCLQLELERGTLLIHLGKFEEAIIILNDCLNKLEKKENQLCPTVSEQRFVALFNLGTAYDEIEELQLAVDTFELAFLLDGEDEELLYSMITIYSDIGNFQRALYLISILLKINPLSYKPYIEQSMIYLKYLNDTATAENKMKILLDYHTGDNLAISQIYSEWAETLCECDYFQLALEKAELAIILDPKIQSKALITKGKSLSKLGKYEFSLIALDKYLEIHPFSNEALSEKSICLLHSSQFSYSFSCLKLAIRISGKKAEKKYDFYLARIFYEQSRFNEAAAYAKQCLMQGSSQMRLASFILGGNALSRQFKYQEALILYNEALNFILKRIPTRLSKCMHVNQFNYHLKYSKDHPNIDSIDEIATYINKIISAQSSSSKNNDMQEK